MSALPSILISAAISAATSAIEEVHPPPGFLFNAVTGTADLDASAAASVAAPVAAATIITIATTTTATAATSAAAAAAFDWRGLVAKIRQHGLPPVPRAPGLLSLATTVLLAVALGLGLGGGPPGFATGTPRLVTRSKRRGMEDNEEKK